MINCIKNFIKKMNKYKFKYFLRMEDYVLISIELTLK